MYEIIIIIISGIRAHNTCLYIIYIIMSVCVCLDRRGLGHCRWKYSTQIPKPKTECVRNEYYTIYVQRTQSGWKNWLHCSLASIQNRYTVMPIWLGPFVWYDRMQSDENTTRFAHHRNWMGAQKVLGCSQTICHLGTCIIEINEWTIVNMIIQFNSRCHLNIHHCHSVFWPRFTWWLYIIECEQCTGPRGGNFAKTCVTWWRN